MRRQLLAASFIVLTLSGCAMQPSNVIRYDDGNGTVEYVELVGSPHPATLRGVSQIHLDREYVTVTATDGTHIIPRERFIRSNPGPATQPASTTNPL